MLHGGHDALACSIGGFLLIDGQFRAGSQRPGGSCSDGTPDSAPHAAAGDAFSHGTSQEDLARLADEAAASLGHSEDSFRLSSETGAALAGDALPASPV